MLPPERRERLKELKCSNTWLNNPNGKWISDAALDKNEIALFDAPAHVTTGILKSGTCSDYSIALTTLLRKSDFSDKEIYTVEYFDHVANIIKFENDAKYHIIDTTGNNEIPHVPGGIPPGYNYCKGKINCFNDNGKKRCPPNKMIVGCENVKDDISASGFKLIDSIADVFSKIWLEIKR